MNYYRRYIGDYLSKTATLSIMEHGAYNLLLDYCYSSEEPIPLDLDDVYRLVRAFSDAERKAVKKVLERYWEKQVDGWHNQRADEELAIGQATIAKQREGGRRTSRHVGQLYTQPQGKETGPPAGQPSGQADNHQPPTTNHQPSASNRQPPTELHSGEAAPAGLNGKGKTVETWEAYSRAYAERYSVEPLRNAKVNGQLGKFIDQVGIEEAPRIAAFYLEHNGGLYVSSGHCIDLLLRDCQKLRTEMLTGRKITKLEAKNLEQKDALREQSKRVGKVLEAQR